jgi:uncharacterized protein (DUF1810 family)
LEGSPIEKIFGSLDRLKFVSSMTLFAAAARDDVFDQALRHCCKGERCEITLEKLSAPPANQKDVAP